MHPTFKQVPPNAVYFSIRAVFLPSWASRIAATYPPGPDPITIASYTDILYKFKNTKLVVKKVQLCIYFFALEYLT